MILCVYVAMSLCMMCMYIVCRYMHLRASMCTCVYVEVHMCVCRGVATIEATEAAASPKNNITKLS